MARMTIDQFRKRMAKATARKELWRSHLDDAYKLALPNRNLFSATMGNTETQQRGERKMDHVYDGTLMRSTIKTANRIQSDLTPPFHKWADFVPGPFIPKKFHDQVRARLEQIRDAYFAALHLSNFDTAVNEFYLDLLSGMGVLMMLENDVPGEAPFNFVAIPRAQVAVEDGPLGTVWATYRIHHVEPKLFADSFGQRFKPPDGFEDFLKKDEADKPAEIHEGVYFDPKDRVYHYDVVWKGTTGASTASDKEGWTRIVEDSMDDSPFIVARWMKVAGETEGRGPILVALPDAKTANKVVEFVLRNAALNVAGLWMARNDGVVNPNTIKIIPGAVIPVGSTGGGLGASIAPLTFGGNFDVAMLVLDDLRANIRDAMMDKGLPEQTGQPRSATEIVARLRELAQDIGSPFGRLMSEFLRPVVQKGLNILTRKGLIELDGQPISVNGAHVRLSMNSPLAREQDINDVDAIVKWATISREIAGEQAAAIGIRVEDLPEFLAGKMNISPSLLRTKQERTVMQQQIGTMVGQQVANSNQAGPGQAAARSASPIAA